MKRSPWLHYLFRPLVMGVMVACIPLSLIEFIQPILLGWNTIHVIAVCVLAALEASFSYHLIQGRELRRIDRIRFRAVELVMLFLLLKLIGYVGDGWSEVLSDIRTWPDNLAAALDVETIAAFILGLITWRLATQTVHDLNRIDEPSERDLFYEPPVETIAKRFYWGGVALLMIAGLPRIGFSQLLDLHRPSLPGLMSNVLVYFVLGLIMLGQVQYATMRERWQVRQIDVAKELAGRWVRYTLAFIGLVALLALVLPTGYSVGVLEAVRTGPILIIALIVFLLAPPLIWLAMQLMGIAGLIFLLIAPLLLWLLSRLVPSELVAEATPIPTVVEPASTPQIVPQVPAPNALFEMLRPLLFWAIMLGMVFYVVRTYLHDRPELVEALLTMRPIRLLRDGWAAFRRWLSDLARLVREQFPQELPLSMLPRETSLRPWRFFRLGALSPRERVLYYYLSIVRRASKRGFPRRRAQTPYEYGAVLEPNLPQVQQEMVMLTRAFVEARYSRRAIQQDQASRVRDNWERVKAAVRGLRRRRAREIGD